MNMYKIGMIDDMEGIFTDYVFRMDKENIELLIALEGMSMESIASWITENEIQLVLIGTHLTNMFDFTGIKLAFYLEENLPDIPVVMMDKYPKEVEDYTSEEIARAEANGENILMENSTEFSDFCTKLKIEIDNADLKQESENE